MAHITAIGMGGRVSADHPDNVMAACRTHARHSDLEATGTGLEGLRASILAVPGVVLPDPRPGLAWPKSYWVDALRVAVLGARRERGVPLQLG